MLNVDTNNDATLANNSAKATILNARKMIMPRSDDSTLPHSRHIDCFSMYALLQTDFTVADNSASQTYSQYISNLYATGTEGWSAEKSSINIREQVLNTLPSGVATSEIMPGLHLKSIGILMAKTIQGTKSEQPPKVLLTQFPKRQ